MSHRLSRLLSLFLVLILLAPMLAACGGDEPTVTPVAAATPAPSRTPLPVADAKGAKATSLPQTRAYTSPDLGFSVDYPSDWQVDAKNAAENGVLFYPPDTETAFWVQKQRFGGSADKANQAGIAFLKETNTGSDIKDVQRLRTDLPRDR
jgi:predicted small lipoprotein YifL